MKLIFTTLFFISLIFNDMAYSLVGKWESLADHYKQVLLSIPESERPKTRSQLKDYITDKSQTLIAKFNNDVGLDNAITRFYSELNQSSNNEAKKVLPAFIKSGPSVQELLFLINYYGIRVSPIIESNYMAVVESYQISTLIEIYILTEIVNHSEDLLEKISLLPLYPEDNWNLNVSAEIYSKVRKIFPHLFLFNSFENNKIHIHYGNNPVTIMKAVDNGERFSSELGLILLGYSRIDVRFHPPESFKLLKNTENSIVPIDYEYYAMTTQEFEKSVQETISYAFSNFNKIKNAMNYVISLNLDKSKKELETLLLSLREKDNGMRSIKLTNQMVFNMTLYYLKFGHLPISAEEYKALYDFQDLELKRTYYTNAYEQFLIEAKRNSLVLKSKARLSELSISQINSIRGANINSSTCHSDIFAFF
jgi:hypothetical protein